MTDLDQADETERSSEMARVAELRRGVLRKLLEDRDLNPTDLARRCGMASPNIFYNYLNGISQSLSTGTYQKIVDALPGVTMEELLGAKKPRQQHQPDPVLVKTICQAGKLRENFALTANRMREVPLPITDSARRAGAYAALVKPPGAEEIYPAGTLLLCLPMAQFTEELGPGRRVIVERIEDGRVEVTIREVRQEPQGGLWLSQRSTHPKYTGAVTMPADGRPVFQFANQKYEIAAVVIGAFVPGG